MQGHRVLIVSLKGQTQQSIPDDVELVELHGKKSVVGLMSVLWRLARLLNRWNPDVVHGHMVVANIISRIASIGSRSAVVVSSAHSVDEGGSRHRLRGYRLTDWLADMTTNASQHAVDSYLRLKASTAGKICVAGNGIDFGRYKFSGSDRMRLRAEFGLTADVPLCLAVGRLVPAKDYPNLIEAFAQVVRLLPHAKLFVVGAGPLADSLKQRIEKLGIANSIQLLGMRTDIAELMSAADLFVLSSAWEGAPLVTIEALACQLPIIATDCGGVSDNLNGFGCLVPVGNSAALAEAIIEELKCKRTKMDPTLIEGRRSALERFSLESVSKRWLSLYKRLYVEKYGSEIQ